MEKITNIVSHSRPITNIMYCGEAARIDQTDRIAGWTHLHQKVYNNKLTTNDITNLKQNEIDVKDKYGQTPMWIACNECNMEMYELLKKHGADIYVSDNQNRTLLHAIASGDNSNCKKIAEDLYDNGCNPFVKDLLGKSAMEDLTKSSNPVNKYRDNNRQQTLNALKLKIITNPISSLHVLSQLLNH